MRRRASRRRGVSAIAHLPRAETRQMRDDGREVGRNAEAILDGAHRLLEAGEISLQCERFSNAQACGIGGTSSLLTCYCRPVTHDLHRGRSYLKPARARTRWAFVCP